MAQEQCGQKANTRLTDEEVLSSLCPNIVNELVGEKRDRLLLLERRSPISHCSTLYYTMLHIM